MFDVSQQKKTIDLRLKINLNTLRLSVKHTNVIARSTSCATSRRFFKHTIWLLAEHISAKASAIDNGSFSKLLHFRRAGRHASRRASYVALDVASVVTLVCGQSLDSRVPRRVPNRARVGVFLALFVYHYNNII